LESLVSDDAGRVTGVVARSKERTLRFGARRGVVLACGGFESNQGMREQYLPKPTDARWTAAPNINHGDGIRAGQALGASVGLMDLTWGAPTIMVPGAGAANAIFIERQLPGCIMVNGNGRRFVNEAAPYLDIVYAMYGDHATSKAAVPCWFVFDGQFRRKYPIGPIMPSTMQPDSKLPKDWIDRVLYRADTLDQLAAKIGVDAAGLAASVERMNEYARTGIDAEFGKGNNAFDRYYGDSTVKPNPCLGALAKPPFYAFRFEAGEIGTKGGLLTDTAARVLREDGAVIEGLYAVGNCSSAVMGPTYPGAGGTLGPAMTFAYLAARHLAGQTAAGGAVGDAAAAKAGAVS
jgi:3-oxosteroid 1-dehydrogenase